MEQEQTFLITGATGMVGGSLARWILKKELPCRIILPVRDLEKAKEMYKGLKMADKEKLDFVEMQLEDIRAERFFMPVDYVIHCACATRSAEMAARPVETADSIVMGTKHILEFARKKQVKSMVYVSSMEVYGVTEDTGAFAGEEELGMIDLKAPRSCYPMGKRMAEHYCHIYYEEFQAPVKIARLAQTFGKGISLRDDRVYMQFARAVFEGRDIVLKTAGKSMGNYCAIDDAVEGIFTILYRGKDGEAYNVVNEANTMKILDMAKLAAGMAEGKKITVRMEIEDPGRTGYAPDTGVRLSGEKLRKLGWAPEKSLEEMFMDLIGEMRGAWYAGNRSDSH